MLLVAFDLSNFDILKFLLAASNINVRYMQTQLIIFGSCNFLP